MRTLVPADTLVYLETNDLGAALQPIVDSKPFNEIAKRKPDLSALNGVQMAVAVTGFETKEEKLTDEHSVGRIQPHFVTVADTHAWNYQAAAFAEQKLGSFVEKIYDSPPTLEKTDKNGGKYFTWSAKDGRKAYALVVDSLIYFGNDPSAIDKCLAVRRGEADSAAENGKFQPSAPGILASGYVGPDGIAQIANIIGLKFASEAAEEPEVQTAIAGILPQILRKSVIDVSWTATQTEQGIEDKYNVTMPPDIANVFDETMAASNSPDTTLLDLVPSKSPSVTIFNLRDPQIAWRSVLLVAQKQNDPLGAKLITNFSTLLFEPYGIHDPELFLSSVGPTIVSARLDEDGEKPVVVATIKNSMDVNRAVSKDTLQLKDDSPTKMWAESVTGSGVSYMNGRVHVGAADGVVACIAQETAGPNERRTENSKRFGEIKASSVTISTDNSLAGGVVSMLGETKNDDVKSTIVYKTETRFTKTGIERRTTSDFGFIGWIIAQLNED